MVSIMSLWLPILLSSVFVFLVSFVVHTLLTYHKNDFGKLPDESNILDALRPFNVAPGEYIAPRAASSADMRTPEYLEKLKKGPVFLITVLPNAYSPMAKNLVQWFLYTVVVGIFSAYIATRAAEPGASYLEVFRFVGATAFFCYVVAMWQDSIWFARSWSTTIKNTFDGLLYALLTAGTFGWLWPESM